MGAITPGSKDNSSAPHICTKIKFYLTLYIEWVTITSMYIEALTFYETQRKKGKNLSILADKLSAEIFAQRNHKSRELMDSEDTSFLSMYLCGDWRSILINWLVSVSEIG